MSQPITTDEQRQNTAMQELIAARVEAIRQAHANNLIENMDMGADALEAMLQRAREPISNEEFTRREEAIWLEECAQAGDDECIRK